MEKFDFTWKNGAEGETPISAENLNKMGDGIRSAEMRAGSLEYNEETKGLAMEGSAAGAKGYPFYAINTVDKKIFIDIAETNINPTIEILKKAGEEPSSVIQNGEPGYLTNLEDSYIYIRFGLTEQFNNIKLIEVGNGYIKYEIEQGTETAFNPTLTEGYHYLIVSNQPTVGSTVITESSLAFGENTFATGDGSLSGGIGSIAGGQYSVAIGNHCISGYASLATGFKTKAIGKYSRTSGYQSQALGESSQAEGMDTLALGRCSHAEGKRDIKDADRPYIGAFGDYSHTEGFHTCAKGNQSHTEGFKTQALGENSHAEGNQTKASGLRAHTEGSWTIASGDNSHAEGGNATASGKNSHAGGFFTIAKGENQTAIGKHNIEDITSAFIIGNGESQSAKSNALTVDWNGNLKIAGQLQDMSGNNLIENTSTLVPVVIDDKTWYFFSDLTWEDNAGYCNFISEVGGYAAFKDQLFASIITTEDGVETLGSQVVAGDYPYKGQIYKTIL